jgi:hypothetical protein
MSIELQSEVGLSINEPVSPPQAAKICAKIDELYKESPFGVTCQEKINRLNEMLQQNDSIIQNNNNNNNFVNFNSMSIELQHELGLAIPPPPPPPPQAAKICARIDELYKASTFGVNCQEKINRLNEMLKNND